MDLQASSGHDGSDDEGDDPEVRGYSVRADDLAGGEGGVRRDGGSLSVTSVVGSCLVVMEYERVEDEDVATT
ncbi:hypothetical protein [Brevibacterium oceani]|uniref:hypothetical protein n=1 Tax=Brevibacterium oceani TaxID=358099 RepID=UPI0015E688B8|nr:hypothetical protein [Brevibacterium oceani]